MKLLLISFLLPIIGLAQNGTTMEEYRYLTKGYGYQHEMGLDHTKEGYELKVLDIMEDQTSFIGMFKEGLESPQALLLILESSTATPSYICIPNESASKEVVALYESHRHQLTYAKKQKVDQALRSFLFKQLKKESVPAPVSYEAVEKPAPVEIAVVPENPLIKKPTITNPTDSPILMDEVFPKGGKEKIVKEETPIIENKKTVATKVNTALATRTIIKKGFITESYSSSGLVSVKICVDAAGDVISAKFTQKGSTTLNEQLKHIAVATARKYQFAISEEAEQCGIITFHFAP